MKKHPFKKVKFGSLLDEKFAVNEITGKHRKAEFASIAVRNFDKEVKEVLAEYGKDKELDELTPLRIYRLLMSKDVFFSTYALWCKKYPQKEVSIDETNGDYYIVTDSPFSEGEILHDDVRNDFMKKK